MRFINAYYVHYYYYKRTVAVKDIYYNIDRIILYDTTTAVIRDAMTLKRAYYCDTRLSTV